MLLWPAHRDQTAAACYFCGKFEISVWGDTKEENAYWLPDLSHFCLPVESDWFSCKENGRSTWAQRLRRLFLERKEQTGEGGTNLWNHGIKTNGNKRLSFKIILLNFSFNSREICTMSLREITQISMLLYAFNSWLQASRLDLVQRLSGLPLSLSW